MLVRLKKGGAVAPFLPKFIKGAIVKTTAIQLVGTCALFTALGLSGCGGGGSADALAPTACSPQNLGACGGGGGGTTVGTTTPTTPTTLASINLSLADSSGADITLVSPDRSGTVQASVKDSKGNGVPNIAVTFTTTDKTGIFVPSSGTALTDTNGVARVGLPAGTQAGAFTLTANAMVGGNTITSSTGYTVIFPTLSFSSMAISPSSLSAGGTASVGLTVLNGTTTFTPAQSVIFSSPCAVAGKATISSPVTTVNGVAKTSYTDKGCGGTDTITASTSLGGATFTQTGTIAVQAATAGQIAFVSALPQNIALKGTGGAGRQESSTVVFKVLDKNGNPVSGQQVNFALTTSVGGLSLNPSSSTTAADGTASTIVAAGTINTPVRVTATLVGTSITTMSDQLVVSTGVPDQNSFSLSTQIFNVEGMGHDGCEGPVGSTVRVSLADHFNNPVPDGTAVSFTAEGGTVDASCLTGLVNTTLTNGTVITQKGVPGQCSVRFCAANPRPADGRITILAYAMGEESFLDTNGNNLFESGESFQDLGEPFRNDRAITNRNANANWGMIANTLLPADPDDIWAKGSEARVAGEIYIDTNSSNGWNSKGDDTYNGVLKSPQTYNNQATHVRGALVQVLSTSEANITALDPSPTLSQCVNGTPFANIAKTFGIAVRDNNPTIFAGNQANTAPLYLPFDLSGNILPAGTKIEFSTSNGTILSGTSFVVPNTNEPSAAAWIYNVTIQSDATQSGPGTTSGGVTSPGYVCSNPVASGLLTVKVTTPLGLITTKSYPISD
jgi:hypothetical protein